MALPKHLDDAADRLHEAFARIEDARARPTSPESLREWLNALTDYSQALMDLHEFSNESVHEKLHMLSGLLKLQSFPEEPLREMEPEVPQPPGS
ncbi:hypothetical protein ATI61_105162 [Archangium gephyra]|uniref:Uncharacterized protein n=1 Tax=Archangium gephyra TaxID=48 RepID=A0AAC8TI27_9BACT|nr:hypothetical protein [Archangium gephyra]AKJ06872.1 Hypothetical protein AA314_08498 [Archangium gephyra]REG31835.1 hypothetical protein ATI61_105162 [Archangium gephyra]